MVLRRWRSPGARKCGPKRWAGQALAAATCATGFDMAICSVFERLLTVGTTEGEERGREPFKGQEVPAALERWQGFTEGQQRPPPWLDQSSRRSAASWALMASVWRRKSSSSPLPSSPSRSPMPADRTAGCPNSSLLDSSKPPGRKAPLPAPALESDRRYRALGVRQSGRPSTCNGSRRSRAGGQEVWATHWDSCVAPVCSEACARCCSAFLMGPPTCSDDSSGGSQWRLSAVPPLRPDRLVEASASGRSDGLAASPSCASKRRRRSAP